MHLSNTMMCVASKFSWAPLTDFSQQSKDVEDKLGDLIPWLIKLKDSVTMASADSNHEETKRREQSIQCVASSLHCRFELTVCRSLEDVEKRSQALLAKGKAARILDKTQDSGTIIKLVEDLRQAILIYQVGTIMKYWDSVELRCFGVAVATAIDRKPGFTIDCKLPSVAFSV